VHIEVEHLTLYEYDAPVRLGPQTLRLCAEAVRSSFASGRATAVFSQYYDTVLALGRDLAAVWAVEPVAAYAETQDAQVYRVLSRRDLVQRLSVPW
jgi:hypothetical protein